MRRLHQVLHIQAQKWQIESPISPTREALHQSFTSIPLLRDIPLRLVTNQTYISYVSAIALPLSKTWQKSPTEIAQNLAGSLAQTVVENDSLLLYPPLDRVWKHFLFEANSSGWLFLKLTDQGLAEWLQSLLYLFDNFAYSPERVKKSQGDLSIAFRNPTDEICLIGESTDRNFLSRNSTDLFFAQHIHARCCSLIALGREIGLMPSGEMPWLDAKGLLRCQYPVERQLLEQICLGWDQVALMAEPAKTKSSKTESAKTVKLIQGLSQAFHRFYGNCSIFGEVRMNDPALAQVRLGLVAVARSLLQVLLEQMDIVAPTEL
jgi:hypothetical protein